MPFEAPFSGEILGVDVKLGSFAVILGLTRQPNFQIQR